MTRCPNKKEINMNNKILLLGAVVTSFTFTTFATDSLLVPRVAGNQPRIISSSATTPAVTIAYVGAAAAPVSPRAQANQIKVVQGVASDRNPALECRNNMAASPRAVAACAQSVTMPGCMKLASLK